MIKHKSPISGVAAASHWIATAGYDNQVILWDRKKAIALARASHDHLANQVTFSPCGQYLATASSDFTARLWTVPDLKLVTVYSGHNDDVEMVLFHPTSSLIATASRDHRARLFSLDGRLLHVFSGHTGDVNSLDWSDDGNSLITTSDDCTVKCWDIHSGLLVREISMQGIETDTIVTVSDKLIIAGNDLGEIVLVSDEGTQKLKAHKAGIKRLKWNKEKKLLVSLSYDRTLKLWKMTSNGLLNTGTTTCPADIWPRSVAFSGEQELVLGTFGTSYATYNFKTEKWDTKNVSQTWGRNAAIEHNGNIFSVGDAGVVFKNKQPQSSPGTLCNFLCSYDETLLTGGQQGIVYDAISGRKIYQHSSPLNCGASFQHHGRTKVVIGTYTGEGLIFARDAKSNVLKLETKLQLNVNAIKGVATSKNFIFSVCATGGLSVYSISDLKLHYKDEKAHDKIANGCVWLRDDVFASISRDRRLRIWNISEKTSQVIETPHTHSIKCIASASNGKWIASGAYNGSVCIYHTELKRWIYNHRITSSGISSLSSENGRFLASSYDGNVYTISPDLNSQFVLVGEV